MKRLLIFLFLASLCSCSSIKLYNESGDKEKGVQFYYPKPYLLVATSTKEEGKEKTISSQIIYLPDLVNPKRAVFKSGFGSSNLSIGLSNGIITAVGQQTDSKIPETITSIAGLATAIAGFKESSDLKPISLYEIKVGSNNKIKLEEVNIPLTEKKKDNKN